MEKWIKDAREQAKLRARWFVEDCFEEADERDIDRMWYLEEVIKDVHEIKKEMEEKE